MSNSASYRLRQVILHLGITSAEFSSRLSVQKSSISHILSGRNKPSFDFLSKLGEKYPEINLEWFITGNGAMIRSKLHQISETVGSVDLNKKIIPAPDKRKDNWDDKTNVNQAEPEEIILVFNDGTFRVLLKR